MAMAERLSSRALSKRRTDLSLVHALIESEFDLARLAKEHFPTGASIRRLAEWYEQPEILALLVTLRRLSEDRAELAVGHARAAAARLMVRLASDETNAESARKACFDLLKLPHPAAGRGQAAAESRKSNGDCRLPETGSALDIEAGREMLERLVKLGTPEDFGFAPSVGGDAVAEHSEGADGTR